MVIKKGQNWDEIFAALLKNGREQSRLSIIFRERIANTIGINVTDGECLDFLLEKKVATAGELAKITGLTTGAITGTLRRLKTAGLISTGPDPQDGRKVIVRPVMEKLLSTGKLYESFGKEFKGLFDDFSSDDLTLVSEYLHRMGKFYLDSIEKIENNSVY